MNTPAEANSGNRQGQAGGLVLRAAALAVLFALAGCMSHGADL